MNKKSLTKPEQEYKKEKTKSKNEAERVNVAAKGVSEVERKKICQEEIKKNIVGRNRRKGRATL